MFTMPTLLRVNDETNVVNGYFPGSVNAPSAVCRQPPGWSVWLSAGLFGDACLQHLSWEKSPDRLQSSQNFGEFSASPLLLFIYLQVNLGRLLEPAAYLLHIHASLYSCARYRTLKHLPISVTA